MPHPFQSPGKWFFPVLISLFFTMDASAAPLTRILSTTTPDHTPKHPRFTLYRSGDTALTENHSGLIRKAKNGDIVIALPANALGHYRVRFFDEKEKLLFEIRQICDPVLIIEKYNFGHAGKFRYELYRDTMLTETSRFTINP